MTIELNGNPVELPDGARVGDAVLQAGGDPERRGVAVAVDGEVVTRRAWGARVLAAGEQVEVLSIAQGG
jgi:sulfur carrier protein